MKNISYEAALSRMAALCSNSEHCESEIREKLKKAAMPLQDIQRIVDTLYGEGYIDTARYCRAFAKDKMRFNQWGPMKIRQALRIKGLPDSDITQAIDHLPQEEYRQILTSLLRQKQRTIADSDPYICRNKLLRFAQGRGFSLAEIQSSLSDLQAFSSEDIQPYS